MSRRSGVVVDVPAVLPRAVTRGCEFGFQPSAKAAAFMVRPGLPCGLAAGMAEDLLRMVRDRLQAEDASDFNADAALLGFAVDAAIALSRATREVE